MDLTAALDQPNVPERPRFRRDDEVLVGSLCGSCGTRVWPARAVCPACQSAEVALIELTGAGTLVTFSTVWVPRPGLDAPYVLAQVELDDGVRLFAHVRELPEPTTGVRLRLVFAPDETAVPPFWFEPE
jgi:uncharacterized protein